MSKKSSLILACFMLGIINTSQGFSFSDLFSKLFSGDNSSPSCPTPPLNICPEIPCSPASGGVFASVPAVTKFINTFLEVVYKSDSLPDAFDLSDATPEENAKYVRDYTNHVLCDIGVDEASASTISQFAAQAIPQLKSLTMPIVSKAYANMAANFLFTDGVLKPEKAEYLAKTLAKSMEDSAKDIKNGDSYSKFLALANGFVSFFYSAGEFTPSKAPKLGFYVGNQWFLAANDKCSLENKLLSK